MNKKTRALSYEQYLKIIGTILTGFVCADGHKVKPNKRIAAVLILEGNLGLRISDIFEMLWSPIIGIWYWMALNIMSIHEDDFEYISEQNVGYLEVAQYANGWYSCLPFVDVFETPAAVMVSDHILDVIERLEDFPKSGSLTPDKWLNEQGYRMVICEKHVAIYRLIEKTVYVYHIADTRTEYTKLFY